MEPLLIKEICQKTNGRLISGNPEMEITGISTDSRTIKKNEFFVPIKGENFDGHEFIPLVIDKGAIGSFIEQGREITIKDDEKFGLIEVENSKFAMGELAKNYRQRFDIPVIAITGSNGKTSTKEMIANILETRYKVLKSEGSFNNDIGIPLTLFQLSQNHEIAVLEMGMNHFGEIRRLVSIIPPDIGLVTNIAEAHLEYFGTLDNIAKAKFELLESMTDKNTAVLNADDERIYQYSKNTKAKTVFFGLNSPKSQFSAESIKFITEPYGIEFVLKTPKGNISVYLPTLGEHQVINAVAAAATVSQFDGDLEMIQLGLSKYKSPKMRMQIISMGGFTLINDAYNSNPKSMRAALDVVQKLPCKGQRIAILADMLELGEITVQTHRQIGEYVAQTRLNYLITIGELAKNISKGALDNGFDSKNTFICESKEQALDNLIKLLKSNDLVLVKGSRKMKLEELVRDLNERYQN